MKTKKIILAGIILTLYMPVTAQSSRHENNKGTDASSHIGGNGNINNKSKYNVSYLTELKGRKCVTKPVEIINQNNKSGIIVVEIDVDRNGKVVSCQGGMKGSTFFDEELIKRTEVAAFQAKFTPKNDAPEKQKGKITYTFKVK